jgi:phosphoglycolate phosphatase
MPSFDHIGGILFDKDGTLIDFVATWVPAYVSAAERVAARAGNPALAEIMLARTGYDRGSGHIDPSSVLAGGTNAEVLAIWIEVLGPPVPDDLEAIMLAAFADFSMAELVQTADLAALFGLLRQHGYKLGIATNDETEVAHDTARQAGIDRFVDFVVGADAGHGGKPGPGMIHAFCAAVGLEPREVILVGDTPTDALTGRNAGLHAVIGVKTGASGHDVLNAHFDAVIDSVADLPALLGLHPAEA